MSTDLSSGYPRLAGTDLRFVDRYGAVPQKIVLGNAQDDPGLFLTSISLNLSDQRQDGLPQRPCSAIESGRDNGERRGNDDGSAAADRCCKRVADRKNLASRSAQRYSPREYVYATVSRREGVVSWQYDTRSGVSGAEVHRAAVADGRIAVGVQDSDCDIERCVRSDLGWSSYPEVSGRARLDLEGPDVDSAAHDAGEAGASLIEVWCSRVVAGIDGGAAGEQRHLPRRRRHALRAVPEAPGPSGP